MRGAVDGAGKPHPEIDKHAVFAHDAVQMGLVRGEFEVGEKAQGAKGERQDGGHDALEEP